MQGLPPATSEILIAILTLLKKIPFDKTREDIFILLFAPNLSPRFQIFSNVLAIVICS